MAFDRDRDKIKIRSYYDNEGNMRLTLAPRERSPRQEAAEAHRRWRNSRAMASRVEATAAVFALGWALVVLWWVLR